MIARIYYSPVAGITAAATHVFIYSPDKQTGRGSDFFGGGRGLASLSNPYEEVSLTDKQFSKIVNYPGFNTGIFIPFFNDCHVELNEAFEYAGVGYKYNSRGVIKRVNPSKVFAGTTSYASQLRDIGYEFFNPIVFNQEKATRDIAELIVRYAKTNHRYANRTGKLTSSARIQKISNDITKVYFSAPYASNVMVSTKDPFLYKAVVENKEQIKTIYTNSYNQAIQADENRIRTMIDNLGQITFKNEFDKILLAQ